MPGQPPCRFSGRILRRVFAAVVKAMKPIKRWSLLILSSACALAVAHAAATPAPAPPDPHAQLAQLLDDSTTPAERQRLFAEAEQRARAGDTQWQYIVGSLLDEAHPPASIPSDPAQARIYLSQAGSHGKILAMAKMAESELAAGHAQEAMDWAQIYAHYQTLQPADQRPALDYLSELVARISDKLDSRAWPKIQADVDAFIAQHDADIRQGPQVAGGASPTHAQPILANHLRRTSIDALRGLARPRSSFADCLIAFRPDGSIDQLWMLDAIPDSRAADTLHDAAITAKLPAAASGNGDRQATRYALISVIYDDGRYHVRNGRIVSGHGL